MTNRLLRKCGSHYVLVMMLMTRVLNFVGGGLVIYYINLTLRLPPDMRQEFDFAAQVLICFSVCMTVLLALWETPHLRRALGRLQRGEPVGEAEGALAGAEAVRFAGRHHLHETFLVPATTVLPLCLYMWIAKAAPLALQLQIVITGFLGISTVLLMTFFACERWMVPVVKHLLAHGVRIPFEALPISRLHVRMNVTFGLAIAVTALMIGALANQRAMDIIQNPSQQEAAVANLRRHTVFISTAALAVGLVLSRMLSDSVAFRVGKLLQAMKRVEEGHLSERITPTGNDEIDILARQFNAMVEKLHRNNQTINDLNVNLEKRVRRRTRQLSKSKKTLQESLTKLKEYDQLKTQFFSNVSHELRTPLTMILAPVERILASDSHGLPSSIVSRLETTRINGHRLLKLINQLLDFSKLEAGHTNLQLGRVDLNRALRSLTEAARPLAEQARLQLKVELDPHLPAFSADSEKLDTIICNLLSNAIKFTPAGGQVHVTSRRRGRMAAICIADTGIGISPENQKRVFERFVQVDGSSSREKPGTGLGMALVKELVELHEGTIQLDSELGKGSRFIVSLPLRELDLDDCDEDSVLDDDSEAFAQSAIYRHFSDLMVCQVDPVAAAPSVAEEESGERATVLVVDDTPEMRAMIGEVISDHYRPLFAANGAEGIEIARRELPDLILSDVMMPHVDGYEFCRAMKSDPATAPIPFIMLTAKAESSMRITGLELGADDYLAKPFNAEELLARVRSLLKLRKAYRDLNARNEELQQTLEELHRTQNQLVQSEKMNSLGQLVAGIAHEINNAINAVYNGIRPLQKKARQLQERIGGYLESASPLNPADGPALNRDFAQIERLATTIEQGAARTARIVSDLKTFSHPGSERAESFNLHEALDICVNLLASEMKHRVTVHRDYQGTGEAFGPSGQLNQVFMNLLHNAQQAIPGEGEITITTRQTDSQIIVRIRDTGVGMTEETRARIFDPFFTTKPVGVGTGLGLSLSYGIISNLGGAIDIKTELGVGTEFTVTLPRRSLPSSAPSGTQSLSQSPDIPSTGALV